MSRNAIMMGNASAPFNPPGLTITHTDAKSGVGNGVHSLTGVGANSLLVVTTGNQNSSLQSAVVTSSPSLTWTKRVDAAVGSSPNAEIWSADFVAGGAITVTVAWPTSVQSSVLYAMTGQDTVSVGGTTGTNQTVTNLNVTTTRTNSIIFCISANWNAPDGGAGGNLTVYRGTPTQANYYRDVTAATFWHYWYPAVNIQAYNVGYTNPVDGDSGTSGAVLEIRSLTGNGPTPDVTDPVWVGLLSSPSKTHNTVNLAWSPATDDRGVTGYQVYVDGSLRTTLPGTATSYQVTGLLPSTAYNFAVVARDLAGNGELTGSTAASNTLPVTTNAAPPNQPPTAPGNFQMTSKSQTTISVSWTASTDPDGTVGTYRVFLNGSLFDTISAPATSYQYAGLTANTTYALKVAAVDTLNLQGPDSTTLNITTDIIDTNVPVWPVNALSSTGQGGNTIDLEWQPGATDNVGVTRYEVHRIGGSNPIATFTGNPPTTLTYTATGLTPNTSYQFFVRAFDAAGGMAQTNTITVSTVNPPPCGNVLTFVGLTEDFRRYWGGAEFWGAGTAAVTLYDRNQPPDAQGNYPTFSEAQAYRRFTWADLEGNTAGSYKFGPGSKIYNFFQTHIALKRMVSFGIITAYPDFLIGDPCGGFHEGNYIANPANGVLAGCPYPTYVHNLMQGEATTKDWVTYNCRGGGDACSPNYGDWIPNYNSPSYLSRLDALHAAIVNWLNTTSINGVLLKHAVGYIDIRGVGSWGEWHHGCIVDNVDTMESAGTFPTNATFQTIINQYRTRYADFQLVMMIAALDKNHANGGGFNNTQIPTTISQYLMNNPNAYGDIGIRRDQWGDTMEYYTLIEKDTPTCCPTTRYLTAPINGEPPGYGVNNMAAFGQQSQTQHASIVGNSNYGGMSGSTFENNMRTAYKNMGHKLRPEAGCYGLNATTLTVRLDWRNFGTTPMYRKGWLVQFEVRNQAGSLMAGPFTSTYDPYLHTKEQGVDSVTDAFGRPAIAAGTYQLRLIVRDPNNYLEPLQLAMTGRQSDGSYILTNSLIF